MKKLLLYTFIYFISFSYAQKKELRSANKLYSSGEFSSALDLLDSSKELFDSSDDKIKAQVMLLYGKIHTSMETFDLAIRSFDMSSDLGTSEQVLNPEINKLETSIITSAIGDNENENFIEAAKKLKMVFDLNEDNNKLYLYYAASSAVNAQDFDLSLEYYLKLRDI